MKSSSSDQVEELFYLININNRGENIEDKRDRKKSFYCSYFEKNKQISSEIWEVIRSLIDIKAAKSSSIKLLHDDGNLVVILK